MKKYSILAAVVIATIVIGLLLIKRVNNKAFRCDAHIVSTVVTGGSKYVLNANINILSVSGKELIAFTNGSMENNGNKYVVARKSFITYAPSAIKDISKARVVREEINPMDTLPPKIWNDLFLVQPIGIDFYAKIQELPDNALLLEGLSNPYVVCDLIR